MGAAVCVSYLQRLFEISARLLRASDGPGRGQVVGPLENEGHPVVLKGKLLHQDAHGGRKRQNVTFVLTRKNDVLVACCLLLRWLFGGEVLVTFTT